MFNEEPVDSNVSHESDYDSSDYDNLSGGEDTGNHRNHGGQSSKSIEMEDRVNVEESVLNRSKSEKKHRAVSARHFIPLEHDRVEYMPIAENGRGKIRSKSSRELSKKKSRNRGLDLSGTRGVVSMNDIRSPGRMKIKELGREVSAPIVMTQERIPERALVVHDGGEMVTYDARPSRMKSMPVKAGRPGYAYQPRRTASVPSKTFDAVVPAKSFSSSRDVVMVPLPVQSGGGSMKKLSSSTVDESEASPEGYNPLCSSVFSRKCACISLILVALLGGVVGLGVMVGLQRKIEGNEVRSSDFSTSASVRYKELHPRLVQISGAEVLKEGSNTPQETALKWLADRDPEKVTLEDDATLVRRYILSILYFSFNGEFWNARTNWLLPNECTWYGVECKFVVGKRVVSSLKMSGNNLDGTLPPEISELVNLEELWIYSNRVLGTIPDSIGKLGSLRALYAQDNSLEGSIPSSLVTMTSLRSLLLSDNELDGSLPGEIGNLSRLEQLQLQGNKLTGVLPRGLGSMRNMKRLWLSQNNFRGAIPTEIGNMINLEALYMDDNFFLGTIPAQISNARFLQDVRLYKNSLSGRIPSTFRTMQNLKILYLDSNFLTGPLPRWLGDLTGLEYLNLSGNRFSGNLPSELSKMLSLKELNLADNQLSGNILFRLGALKNLETLNLSANNFEGAVPKALGLLGNLNQLNLERNLLNGEVPNVLCKLGLSTFVVDCALICTCCSSCYESNARTRGNGFN